MKNETDQTPTSCTCMNVVRSPFPPSADYDALIAQLAALREERNKWRESSDSKEKEVTDLLRINRNQREELAALREENERLRVERDTEVKKLAAECTEIEKDKRVIQHERDEYYAELEPLREENAKREKDKARLDWIEKQTNAQQWLARQSTTGRGFRLHNTSADGHQTAREALDAAME